MENIDFITIWKTQNAKLDEALAINKKLLRNVVDGKAQSALRSLKILKSGFLLFPVIRHRGTTLSLLWEQSL